jgi:hypothetical protein
MSLLSQSGVGWYEHCSKFKIMPIFTFLPDLINRKGRGYLQKSFSFKCPASHIFNTITKETLAVRKLATDLAGPPSDGLS